MKLSDCKQYDVVRIHEIRQLADFKIDSICRREPKVGDVATIVEVYTSPVLGFELECCDDDGVTNWLHAFTADDLVIEKLQQRFVESSSENK